MYLATAPGLETASGGYFANCKPAKTRGSQPGDAQLAKQLWQLSEELTGVKSGI